MENDYFGDVENSMFASVFLPHGDARRDHFRIPLPREAAMDNLSHVSLLYVYTNPPPSGTGVPSPKIAETVLRANEYNRNPGDKKYRYIGKYKISRNRWVGDKEDGDAGKFPMSKVHGNFNGLSAYKMMKSYINSNRRAFDTCAESAIDKYLNMNPGILTKGNQTWCPLTRSSIPSARAYENMMKFFQLNLEMQPRTMVEVIQFIHLLFTKDEIKGPRWEPKLTPSRERSGPSGIMKSVIKKSYIRKDHVYKGEEAKDFLMELMTSFCGYIKLGERGKAKKRAIASPNMFLRTYLEIIESVHLELGRLLKGSTISIGGDEKKNKIQTVLMSLKKTSYNKKSAQATQDATKWNECLSAELFALFAACAFDEKTGCHPNTSQRLFYEICKEGHMLLALKRIHVGLTPMCFSEEHYNRPELTAENLSRFNEDTRKWMEKCLPDIENGYLKAPNGMLMGMHNALSTTVALAATIAERAINNIVTLRSSDDSTTIYVCEDRNALRSALQSDHRRHKELGVNFSVEKTLLFPEGFGEYTSWYFDGKFLSQYGTDTSQLRPGGKNPYDDMGAMMSQTAVAQTRLECNPFGAVARVQLSICNIRRLYRVQVRDEPREPNISLDIHLIADGGPNPFTASNCHLDEIAWKRSFCQTPEEVGYIEKICTVDNPFCNTLEEDVTWSKDKGELVLQTIEIPRNIFTFQRRRNRTLNTERGKSQAESEKSHSEALKIIQLADPTTFISVPNSGERCNTKVINEMTIMKDRMDLTPEEEAAVSKAILKLSGLDSDMFDYDDTGILSDVE